MFVSAVHRYLLWAFVGAVTLAVVLSFVLMRRVLAPLSRMSVITHEIAAGNFSARVPTGTQDEVGQLARAFNRMAAGLEEIETLRRTLMIDVAHELRTPLTNIRGYLEALNDRVLPFSTETFNLLQNETMRLAELVEDVLQLARADAAHGQLDRQPVDLANEIKTTLDYFARAFDEKSVTVNYHSTRETLIVPADRRRLARVLRNLTDNAARYAPAGSAVDIRLDADSRQAQIDYINSAERLMATDLPYLFERFYRGEKSRSRQHGGAGIGLAIVKELVEAHDGRVSAALEDGRLRIRLTLPINPEEQIITN
jgi:signal transduction histidine kinase